MARHSNLLLGQVGYSLDLTYNEVMALESEYIQGLSELLSHYGADHLDFWGQGDALQLEAQLDDLDEETLRNFCGEVCTLLQPGSAGRLMLIDRNLLLIDLYHLNATNWRHERIEIEEAFYRRAFRGHGPI